MIWKWADKEVGLGRDECLLMVCLLESSGEYDISFLLAGSGLQAKCQLVETAATLAKPDGGGDCTMGVGTEGLIGKWSGSLQSCLSLCPWGGGFVLGYLFIYPCPCYMTHSEAVITASYLLLLPAPPLISWIIQQIPHTTSRVLRKPGGIKGFFSEGAAIFPSRNILACSQFYWDILTLPSKSSSQKPDPSGSHWLKFRLPTQHVRAFTMLLCSFFSAGFGFLSLMLPSMPVLPGN